MQGFKTKLTSALNIKPVGFLLFLFLPFGFTAAQTLYPDARIEETSTLICSDPTVIHLPCGIELDTRAPEVKLPSALTLSNPQEGLGTYIVQFDGPIYEEERAALEQAGTVIDGYIPNYAYIVRMNEETREQASRLPFVIWIGDYQPGFKLCRDIHLEETTPQEMDIILYPGIGVESFRACVESAGGQMIGGQAGEWETVVRAVVAPDRLTSVLCDSRVKWIEPYYQSYFYNGSAQWVIQTNKLNDRRIWDMGLKGEGQIINILDSGVRTTHNFFRDPNVAINDFGDYPTHRKIISYQKTGATQPTFGDDLSIGHGTHTSGSALGNDEPVGGTSTNTGMAPEAKLYFLDGGSSSYPGVVFIGFDLESNLTRAYSGGARISSHSWGNQTTRAYNSYCQQADRAMWNHDDFLVVVSAGNLDQGQYTGSPGNAKDVICVGACQNGAFAKMFASDISSSGPSGDGRIRPDLLAPGKDIMSASSTADAAEKTMSGTSMSCPIIAGSVALVRQYFTEGWYPTGTPTASNKTTPSGALLKAMMINSVETDYFGRPVPDTLVGWGRPKLDNVLYFPNDSLKLWLVDYSAGLQTGKEYVKEITLVANKKPLRVTLVWTDYPAQSNASPALVNDLNLEVTSPTGKIYMGNNFANKVSVTGGSFDSKNPVENVFLTSPEIGKWTVKVKANNVPSGPQKFALVITSDANSGVEETETIPQNNALVITEQFPDRTFSVGFYMPQNGFARIEMFDASGRLVKSLLRDGGLSSGNKKYIFDTNDRTGRKLPKGVYFIKVETPFIRQTAKLLVLN